MNSEPLDGDALLIYNLCAEEDARMGADYYGRAWKRLHERNTPDPAILAAMDETLSYFDGSTGSEEDTPIHSWVPHGLTVGMLRTFRGILG